MTGAGSISYPARVTTIGENTGVLSVAPENATDSATCRFESDQSENELAMLWASIGDDDRADILSVLRSLAGGF